MLPCSRSRHPRLEPKSITRDAFAHRALERFGAESWIQQKCGELARGIVLTCLGLLVRLLLEQCDTKSPKEASIDGLAH